MEDGNNGDNFNQRHDPLLTDDSCHSHQQCQTTSHFIQPTSPSSLSLISMADPSSTNEDLCCQANQGFEAVDTVANDVIDGRSLLGFSLTSPDLVICAGSPEIPTATWMDTTEFLERNKFSYSFELSLENGIKATNTSYANKTPSVKFSTVCQTFGKDLSPESSLELYPQQDEMKLPKTPFLGININAGSTNGAVVLNGVEFLEDTCYSGGDHVRTNAEIGNGEEDFSIFQTARFGNFSYYFQPLEPGNYFVNLHLAEIVFTDGPPGMRVFDVFLQEKKVVSCLDIFSQVGANNPLVLSDLKACVDGEEGLTIRFEGVIGSPIVCGISITKDSSDYAREAQFSNLMGISQVAQFDSAEKENRRHQGEEDYQKLLRRDDIQKSELTEVRRELEALKRENQLKNRECEEAWKSLKELQNELMRKSMHVGSLAFAIEGQVKEKSKWFTSLRDVTRKLKIMKMEHIKLSQEALEYKKCLADMDEMRSSIQSTFKEQVALHENLKIKYIEGAKERKELYNKVLELKGNIKVFCRCRPLNAEEIALGASMAIDFETANDGELTVISNGLPRKTFKFDAVFSPQADQANVFEDTAPFATSVLDGYNVCIFAYGQTGTGKTFTMEGTDKARGVNFRTLEEMFWIIKERNKLFQYDVSVSVLEVYNEQIRDLLGSGSQPGLTAKRLEIRQVGEGLHHVPGLVEAQVNNISEAWEVLQTGSNARAVGSTNANEHSSRSHCIHCVMVKGHNLLNGECTKSKLWLVDLAGSERIARTEVQGERLKEAQNINRSLSALGDVISALATKSPHVPFRNSKLTHLLQDSLGGDSKTLMFVQISPNENDLGETLCSLNFASRVRGIELGPAKRQLDTAELLRYKQIAEKSKQDLKNKDIQIRKMEETINGLDFKVKEKEFRNKNLQEKIKELESQLLIERKLARQHVDSKIAEQHHQQQMKQDEQNIAPLRPPLAIRSLLGSKNSKEAASSAMASQPLAENSSYKPAFPVLPRDGIVKVIDPIEKENNPEMAEQPRLLPKRTGRTSICTTAQRIAIAPTAPRRTSLIPLPSSAVLTVLPPPFIPLPSCNDNIKEVTEGSEYNCLPEQTHCNSPKGMKSGTKKLSCILRRSLQKRNQMRSPLQQQLRKGGINVGMEKVRVSIGSRGRMAQRVVLGNGRRAGFRDHQQNRIQREKEKGWNIGRIAM
ncbi:kinesin-like protein KIN-14Q isoform X2 [Euphorbia lathyris]|uniref:kinesin-like protein KIN-14Q isoform X2 n=1 Tax=Euphorbia lathyris TaxID=212925 RepID=UPI003313AE63